MDKKRVIQEKYGELFYHDLYGRDAILLREALEEIAEHLGNTMENPISISLLCLQFLMPQYICRLIYLDILKLIKGKNAEELKISQVKEIMVKHFPEADGYSDLTIRAFIKAIAKCWLPELRPFADNLS